MSEKMLTKQFRFKVDVENIGEDGQFSGYASIFGAVDSYGDIVDKGAFKKTIKDRKRTKLLWSHDAQEPPIGYVELAEDDKGLKVTTGQLYLQIERAKEAYINMKNGTLDGLSIGYNVVKESIDRTEKIRHLKEVALWEVSLCNFQACPGAVVMDVKTKLAKVNEAVAELDPDEITPEDKPEIFHTIESLIALHGKQEPPAGTPAAPDVEPPVDSDPREVALIGGAIARINEYLNS